MVVQRDETAEQLDIMQMIMFSGWKQWDATTQWKPRRVPSCIESIIWKQKFQTIPIHTILGWGLVKLSWLKS